MLNIQKMARLLLLLLALLPAACEKKLEVSLSAAAEKPVLNVTLKVDSIIHARVTFSGRVADGETFKEPDQAAVQLFENGLYIETLQPVTTRGLKYYYSKTKARDGHIFKVTAAIPGYEIVEGTDITPSPTALTLNDQSVFEVLNSENEVTPAIRFTLNNTSSVPVYYRFQLYHQYTQEMRDANGTTYSEKVRRPLEVSYLGTNNNFIDNHEAYSFFPDEPLLGNKSSLYAFATVKGTNIVAVDTMILVVATLTDASYQYLASASHAEAIKDDPFAEKIPVYSNIKNGLGIVGGMAIREYEFTKK